MNALFRSRARGRPLIVLAALMAGWIGWRFALWPEAGLDALGDVVPASLAAVGAPERTRGSSYGAPETPPAAPAVKPASATAGRPQAAWSFAFASDTAVLLALGGGGGAGGTGGLAATSDGPGSRDGARRMIGGPPPTVATTRATDFEWPQPGGAQSYAAAQGPGRWSVDSWLLLRKGGAANAAASPASYDASQAGLLVRYRLAPNSPNVPALYARATGFPDGIAPPELAVGFAARPIGNLPVTAQVEVRLREIEGRIEARPAALLVGGIERRMAEFELQAYGQAGFVAGTDATLFADGKATLARIVSSGRSHRFSLGAGAWGGAQDGAARFDVGPSAGISLTTGRVSARVEADYRFRVAGDAAPGSGPALTLSASF